MAVSQYVIAVWLTAACLASVAFASSTTEDPTTSDAASTNAGATDSSTAAQSTAQSTAQATDPATTATPRNIACYQHTCEWPGCFLNATAGNTQGSCNTSGNCFVKRTSNSTYTKEEVGCDSDATTCTTTIHDNGDGKRICCTINNCNDVITHLDQQSKAPYVTFSVGIIVTLLVLFVSTL